MSDYILKCGLVIIFSVLLIVIAIGFIAIFPYIAYKSKLQNNSIIIMEGWKFEYK